MRNPDVARFEAEAPGCSLAHEPFPGPSPIAYQLVRPTGLPLKHARRFMLVAFQKVARARCWAYWSVCGQHWVEIIIPFETRTDNDTQQDKDKDHEQQDQDQEAHPPLEPRGHRRDKARHRVSKPVRK